MKAHRTTRRRAIGWSLGAVVIIASVAVFGLGHAPAHASGPTALQLVDHALTNPSLLADESPYELIDPVGPGGITLTQAKDEVSSSTMKGGLYNDNGRSNGYGSTYFMPAQPVSLPLAPPLSGYREREADGGYGR